MATSLDPSAILAQLTEGFVKLPLVQKILFPFIIAGSIMGIIFVSKWANTPDYATLYSDLGPADSAAVIERLKAQKIKYEIRGDGSTIAVSPPEAVHELRISLAGEGVPKGGVVGLEIFDSANLGTTTFQEKIKFQRAIQGELERTIASIDAIASARVHITQPEKTVFAKQGAHPTASVLLKLRAGGELDKKQVKGIANLVAGSVEGLKAEDVSIVDVFGNLLNAKEDANDMMGMEATRLTYQREIESSYVQRIEQMLSRVLGPGKVIARVTADLDFTQNEREEESFDPAGQVIRSEKSIVEGAGGGAQVRAGVPGVVSNVGSEQPLLAPQNLTTESANRKEQVKNYEVSRAVTKTIAPRGKLVRLSAAVLVDGAYETAASDSKGAEQPRVFKPLSAEMVQQIESLAKTAIGYDSSRGDTLTVENIQFIAEDEKLSKELDAKANQDMILNIVMRAGPIIFILLFFLVIVRPLVRFLTTPTEAEVDLQRLLPTGIAELEQELEAERARPELPELEQSVDLDQLEEILAENSRIVKENPQQAALLIRYWLNDGRL